MKYHIDIHMPDEIKNYQFAALLKYSKHARQEAADENITLPMTIDSRECSLIEAEVENGKVCKVLYRKPYSKTHDLCIAIIPDTRVVKTVWLNSNQDHHRTLDKSAYAAG